MDIWREPVRGGYPDPRLFGLSGLDFVKASLNGHAPRPPISHLTGMTLTEAEEKRVVVTMPASEWFLSSQDQISVGAITMLADVALAAAVMVGLPPATPYATAELSMSFLQPCARGGELRALGLLLHMSEPLALSGVWVQDGRGEPVAYGTSSCFVSPAVDGLEPPDELPVIAAEHYETPDPYLRAIEGESIPWDEWRTMTGEEISSRQVTGDLPDPPIHYLTGMTLVEVTEGQATFTMPASEWLTSPLRTVEGGAIAMLAHAALATSVSSTLETGMAYRPVDVKVNFLRPVAADGVDLVAHGRVTNRGKTLAVASADVVDGHGKKVAVATGSTMILSERQTASS